MKRLAPLLLSAIVPAFILLVAHFYCQSRGPFYYPYYRDPDYPYLLNSLNLLHGQGVWHVDHPGATAQLVGAAAIKLTHLSAGHGPLAQDVLGRPELYLSVINWVFIAIYALAVLLAGYGTYRLAGKWWLALLLQVSPFLSVSTLAPLARVTPEPLLATAALLMAYLLLRVLVRRDTDTHRDAYEFKFALVVAFGMATKITFLPLALIPLVLLPSLASRVYYGVVAVLSFLIFTLPGFHMYPYFVRWVKDIVTHAGIHGKGDQTVLKVSDFVANVLAILSREPLFTASLAITAAMATLGVLLPGSRKRIRSLPFKVTVATAMAMLLQLAMVGKHYSDYYLTLHYMIPALMLTGAGIVAAGTCLREMPEVSGWFSKGRRSLLPYALEVVLVAVAAYYQAGSIVAFGRLTGANQGQFGPANAFTGRLGSTLPVIVYQVHTSSVYYALYYGKEWSDPNGDLYRQTLQKLYPHVYFYNAGANEFTDWNGQIVLWEEIAAAHPVFVVRGMVDQLSWAPEGSKVEKWFDHPGSPEKVFRLALPSR